MKHILSTLAIVGLCLASVGATGRNLSGFSEFRCGKKFVTMETVTAETWLREGLSIVRIDNIVMVKKDKEANGAFIFLSDMNRQDGFWIRIDNDTFDRVKSCINSR